MKQIVLFMQEVLTPETIEESPFLGFIDKDGNKGYIQKCLDGKNVPYYEIEYFDKFYLQRSVMYVLYKEYSLKNYLQTLLINKYQIFQFDTWKECLRWASK